MQYTSDLKKLILPEYGRNVQQMVDHCMTIEDRAERTRCANTIINIYYIFFSHITFPLNKFGIYYTTFVR